MQLDEDERNAMRNAICEQWVSNPDYRPTIFFTMGDETLLVEEYEPQESICRQFWQWTGIPDEYDSSVIDIHERGHGLHLSLQDQTHFKVVFQDKWWTTTVSRNNNRVEAVVELGPGYKPTRFSAAQWPKMQKPSNTLLFLNATLSDNDLEVQEFYSKVGSSWELVGRDDKVRGAGQYLFCLVLRMLPAVRTVSLDASGGIPHLVPELKAAAKDMPTEKLMSDILDRTWDRNKKLYAEKYHKRPDMLPGLWVEMQSNLNLVRYYEKHFGLEVSGEGDILIVPMSTTRERMLQACTNHKRGRGEDQGHAKAKRTKTTS